MKDRIQVTNATLSVFKSNPFVLLLRFISIYLFWDINLKIPELYCIAIPAFRAKIDSFLL